MIQGVRLDPVDQLARLALGRHEVEPAARQDGVGRQCQHAAGQHVEAAEIVEEPAVQPQVT